MRILVAIDGSEHSHIALRQCLLIAQRHSVSATILSVIKEEAERMEREAMLVEAATELQAVVVQLVTQIRHGSADEQIVQEAATGSYDLLILGERPQHNWITRLLGPTALRILAQQSCPVLIAKEQQRDLNRILICDGAVAERSLLIRFAHYFPKLIDQAAKVTLLHVMSQISAAPGVPGQQLRAGADELIASNAPEGQVLAKDVTLLADLDVVARPKVRHGLVVEEILTEASDGRYDLIVIGAHPHEGWQRFLLEDITAQIVLKAERPVLVIP